MCSVNVIELDAAWVPRGLQGFHASTWGEGGTEHGGGAGSMRQDLCLFPTVTGSRMFPEWSKGVGELLRPKFCTVV